MKKTFFVTVGLILMTAASLAFTKDDPGFKNLKVLPKKITKKQLDSVMHHFSNALGVHCSYCHVHNDSTRKWDFASDENKHKLRAREMFQMMNKINDKYFDVTGAKKDLNTQLMVTCYTCHHGATQPVTKPPMMERPPQKPQPDSTKRNQ